MRSSYGSYLRNLDPELSRPAWTRLSGSFFNALGNGVVFPFLLILRRTPRRLAPAAA